jgi:hypothetical protein
MRQAHKVLHQSGASSTSWSIGIFTCTENTPLMTFGLRIGCVVYSLLLWQRLLWGDDFFPLSMQSLVYCFSKVAVLASTGDVSALMLIRFVCCIGASWPVWAVGVIADLRTRGADERAERMTTVASCIFVCSIVVAVAMEKMSGDPWYEWAGGVVVAVTVVPSAAIEFWSLLGAALLSFAVRKQSINEVAR